MAADAAAPALGECNPCGTQALGVPGSGIIQKVAVAVVIGVLGLVVVQFWAESVFGRRQLRAVFAKRGWELLDARRRLTVSNRVKFHITLGRDGERREGTAFIGSWWVSPLWQPAAEVEFELEQR